MWISHPTRVILLTEKNVADQSLHRSTAFCEDMDMSITFVFERHLGRDIGRRRGSFEAYSA